MLKADELVCPCINKLKAEFYGTLYYCEFDGMEFDSMNTHCKHCEMYENLMKKAKRMFREVCDDRVQK